MPVILWVEGQGP